MKSPIKLNTSLLTLCAILGGAVAASSQPAIEATTPTLPQGRVISLWNSSGTYTNVPVDNYNEVWYGTTPGTYTIPSTSSTVFTELNMICCGGWNFSSAPINASGCTNMHVDVYTPNGNSLIIRIVDTSNRQADMVYTPGGGVITNNGWISLDIPLAALAASGTPSAVNLTSLKQIGWIDNGAGSATPADYYIDNVYFNGSTNLVFVPPPPVPAPTNSAAVPTYSSDSVISMYNSSATYTDRGGINWHAGWSGSTESDHTITNSSTVVKYMPGLSYVGVEFYDPNQIDTTGFTGLHFDVWSLDATNLGIQLVSLAPTSPAQVNTFIAVTQQWVSVNIPLSQFTTANPATDLAHLQQLLWLGSSGTYYVDNIYFYSNAVPPPPVVNYPTNNAPIPTRPASTVLSMYNSSATYSDSPGIGWYAGWSGASGSDYTITNTGNVVKRYSGLAFAGVEFYGNPIDATPYSALHVDIWTPNANQFGVKPVSFNSPNQEAQYNFTNGSGIITTNGWISLDIPLNRLMAINPAMIMTNLQQLLWVDNGSVGSGVQNGTFYIDNVYFWTTNIVQSTLGNGKVISWSATSGGTYQPQKSANNVSWFNLGGVLSGNSTTSVFDASPVGYYQVIETASTASNAVANGGFETPDGSAPYAANWLAAGSGGAIANPVRAAATDPFAGSTALEIEGQGNGVGAGPVALQNNVPAAPGANTFSFRAKGALMSGGANPQYCVFWFDASNALLGGGFASFPTALNGSYQLETVNLTAPANTDHAQIQFLLAVGAGAGDHWLVRIDDVSLVGAGSPTTNTLPATVQSGVGISWLSGKRLTYNVQSSTNLTGGVWSNFGSSVIGTGTNSVGDATSAPGKFYRVLEVY